MAKPSVPDVLWVIVDEDGVEAFTSEVEARKTRVGAVELALKFGDGAPAAEAIQLVRYVRCVK